MFFIAVKKVNYPVSPKYEEVASGEDAANSGAGPGTYGMRRKFVVDSAVLPRFAACGILGAVLVFLSGIWIGVRNPANIAGAVKFFSFLMTGGVIGGVG